MPSEGSSVDLTQMRERINEREDKSTETIQFKEKILKSLQRPVGQQVY